MLKRNEKQRRTFKGSPPIDKKTNFSPTSQGSSENVKPVQNKMNWEPTITNNKRYVVMRTIQIISTTSSLKDFNIRGNSQVALRAPPPSTESINNEELISTPILPKRKDKEKAIRKGESRYSEVRTHSEVSDIVQPFENTSPAREVMQKPDLVQTVHDLIMNNAIIIFSKTYCPFSRMAKEIFDSLNQYYRVEELDKRSDGEQIQDILSDMTGARTVPRVFVKGQFLGGGSDLRNLLLNGELQKIIGDIAPRV